MATSVASLIQVRSRSEIFFTFTVIVFKSCAINDSFRNLVDIDGFPALKIKLMYKINSYFDSMYRPICEALFATITYARARRSIYYASTCD